MIINPSTTIKLYSGMPLDNTYTNTLYWSSKTNQNNFFHLDNPYYKHTANVSTYQRINKGVCEVEIPADDIYDCNYMAFQNSNYGSKWFYAFITSVEYVNNANSRVYYEIDVMQTYWFDAELKECYVVREHSLTDNPGDNLLNEPVTVFNHVCGAREEHSFTNFDLVVCRAKFGTMTDPTIIGNMPVIGLNGSLLNTCDYEVYRFDDLQDGIPKIQTMLRELQGDYGSIITMYMYPRNLCGTKVEDTGKLQYILNVPNPINVQISRPVAFFNPNDITNNYVPKNKKMLCYPYNYLAVDFGNITNEYRYEYFRYNEVTPNIVGTARFIILGNLNAQPEILLVPTYYKGSWYSPSKRNFDESMKYTDLPRIAFPIDSFLSWFAQNGTAMATRLAFSGLTGSLGGSIGFPKSGETFNPTKGGVSSMTSMLSASLNAAADAIQAETCTNRWSGLPESTTRFAYEGIKFVFKEMQVEYNEAKRIDDFFTRYGYTCDRLKIPSRNNRPHWTYIQTDQCNIVGEFPSDDIAHMKAIYDKGITFWNYASEVGDYSLDNSPY